MFFTTKHVKYYLKNKIKYEIVNFKNKKYEYFQLISVRKHSNPQKKIIRKSKLMLT